MRIARGGGGAPLAAAPAGAGGGRGGDGGCRDRFFTRDFRPDVYTQVGFDWVKTGDVIDKAEEEIRELREAVVEGGGKSPEAEEEFGDLLFSLVNVARKLGIEPEGALRVANDKFQRRFDDVERQVVASGQKFRDLTLEQLEASWQIAKQNANTKARRYEG